MTRFQSKWLVASAGGREYATDKTDKSLQARHDAPGGDCHAFMGSHRQNDKTDKSPPVSPGAAENRPDKTDKRAFVSFVGSSPAPSGENRTPQPPPPARPIDPNLAARVDAALRRGQWVRIATAYGDVILAPNGRAAERAAQRHPGLPIFRPAEWKELLACETREELAVLIELKRTLGADLIRAEPVAEDKVEQRGDDAEEVLNR